MIRATESYTRLVRYFIGSYLIRNNDALGVHFKVHYLRETGHYKICEDLLARNIIRYSPVVIWLQKSLIEYVHIKMMESCLYYGAFLTYHAINYGNPRSTF